MVDQELNMSSEAVEISDQAESVRVSDADRQQLLLGGLLVGACFVFLFWNFLRAQFNFAIHQQADWGHTLIIPFITGYFVYLKRETLLKVPFRTNWLGLLPIIVGAGAYFFFWLGPDAFMHHNLQGAAVALTLFGIVLTFFGTRATGHLLFPLAYLAVFGQRISDRLMGLVTNEMQDIAAIGSYYVLILLGFTVEKLGNVLVVVDQAGVENPLNIAEACSGMRMLMAFLALGVFIAYTGLSRLWQQVALVLLAVPTAIFVNILRVVTLAWLSLYDTDFAAGDFHHFIGLVWLVPALFIYLGLVWVLRNLVIEPDAPTAGGTPS